MPGNRSDYGTEQTDRAVKRVERRLSSVYRQAQRDIDDKLKDWQERHKKRDARYRQMVAAGKMSKEDYRAWVRGQVFQEKQWQARRDQIDNILLNADRAAQNIVNEGKLGVFAANANYMGYALERDSNIDTGFVLYSESTVARLIEDDPQILPKPAPGVQKDLAFPYYNKLMSSAITQGIVQGETISEIAGRVARTTGESSYKSAMRNARTAYTGAQNAGRIEGLHQAQRLGIKVKKKWLAILDSRTRDTHRDLDGQTQEVDDPFVVDGDEIKFPGDPTAKPALTYNCRCTLTYEYPDYPSTMPRRDAENGQIVADMTYREWEALKKGDGKATEKPNAPVAKVIQYGDLFPDEAEQITRDTLDDLNREYPLSHELDYVGDVRTHRGLDPEIDIFDLHHEYPKLVPCGAQYLPHGVNGKGEPCIEIHKESYSTQKLQDEFDERYAIRLRSGDPMKPPTLEYAFFTVSDTFEGTIRHEYGHALSDDKGVFGSGLDNPFVKWEKEYWETHRAELLAISRYAASLPEEMFAEAFVQAQDTRHPDTLAYKLSREIMDAFERYTRGEPL